VEVEKPIGEENATIQNALTHITKTAMEMTMKKKYAIITGAQVCTYHVSE